MSKRLFDQAHTSISAHAKWLITFLGGLAIIAGVAAAAIFLARMLFHTV